MVALRPELDRNSSGGFRPVNGSLRWPGTGRLRLNNTATQKFTREPVQGFGSRAFLAAVHEAASMPHRGVRAGQGRGRVIYDRAGSTMMRLRPRLIR